MPTQTQQHGLNPTYTAYSTPSAPNPTTLPSGYAGTYSAADTLIWPSGGVLTTGTLEDLRKGTNQLAKDFNTEILSHQAQISANSADLLLGLENLKELKADSVEIATDLSNKAWDTITIVAGTGLDGAGTADVAEDLSGNPTGVNLKSDIKIDLRIADSSEIGGVKEGGDILIDSTGVMTVGPDAVALGNDTTGNYVAEIADSGSTDIIVNNNGTETALVTLGLTTTGVTSQTSSFLGGVSGNTVTLPKIKFDTRGRITGKGTATFQSANDSTVTLTAGTDIDTIGDFTLNKGTTQTLTITHSDTSTLTGSQSVGSTITHATSGIARDLDDEYGANHRQINILDSISVDGRGHVTAVTTRPITYGLNDALGGTGGSAYADGGTYDLHVPTEKDFQSLRTLHDNLQAGAIVINVNDVNAVTTIDRSVEISKTLTVSDDLVVDGDTLFVDSRDSPSGTGKVGINLGNGVNPTEALDLLGNIKVTGNITASTNLTIGGNTSLGNASTDITTITGSLAVDNLKLDGNIITSTSTNGLIKLDPAGSGYVQIVGTNGLVIPAGAEADKGPNEQGAIRYNTTNSQFEGYSGTNWSSLGGVRSVDGLTFINAESAPGDSDDTLHFHAATGNTTTTEVATLDDESFHIKNTTDSVSSSTGALKVDGGARITKQLRVGSDLVVEGNATIGNSTSNGHVLMGSSYLMGDVIVGSAALSDENLILFGGTTNDPLQHTVIANRLYAATEKSELLFFKGNDASTTGSVPGPDRIRHRAAQHVFQTYTSRETYDGAGASDAALGDDNTRLIITTAGQVGIGTDAPTSGITLDVRGSVRASDGTDHVDLTNTGSIELKRTSDPFIDFKNDNSDYDCRILQSSEGLGFRTGSSGANQMFISSDGIVGIGTSSPGGNLHVVGATGDAGRIYVSDKDNGEGASDALLIAKSGTSAFIYNRDNGDLRLGSNDNNEHVTIDSNGDVGIGTIAPSCKLDVAGNIKSVSGTNAVELIGGSIEITRAVAGGAAAFIDFKTASGDDHDCRIEQTDDDGLAFTTGGEGNSAKGKRVTILKGGEVGIGTTSPGFALDVVGDIKSSVDIRSGSSGKFISTHSAGKEVNLYHGASYGVVGTTGETKMAIRTNNTDRVTVLSGGNVGIGTSSPSSKLEVAGDILIDNGGADGGQLILASEGFDDMYIDNERGSFRVVNHTNPAELFTIGSDGNVGIGNPAPTVKLDVKGPDDNSVSLKATGTIQAYNAASDSRAYGFLSVDDGYAMIGGNLRLDDSITSGTHAGFDKGTLLRGSSGIKLAQNASSAGEITFLTATDTGDETYTVSETMRITNGGAVGIGTNDPGSKLDVAGTATVSNLESGSIIANRTSDGKLLSFQRSGTTFAQFEVNTGHEDTERFVLKTKVGNQSSLTTRLRFNANGHGIFTNGLVIDREEEFLGSGTNNSGTTNPGAALNLRSTGNHIQFDIDHDTALATIKCDNSLGMQIACTTGTAGGQKIRLRPDNADSFISFGDYNDSVVDFRGVKFYHRNSDASALQFSGGKANATGARLLLYGPDHSTQGNEFLARADEFIFDVQDGTPELFRLTASKATLPALAKSEITDAKSITTKEYVDSVVPTFSLSGGVLTITV